MKKNLNQINVILDTDIGFDPDDLFALLLVLKSSEVKLELVITGNEVGGKRAIFAKKILEQCGYPDIQVVRGEDLGNHFFVVDELIADVQYDIASDYLSAMKDIVGKREKITYIGLNGFTNLANFLRRHPEDLRKLQIFQMGGALNYSRGPDWAEHNVKTDTRATQYVLNSGVEISLVMAQTTFNPAYLIDDNHRIFRCLKRSDSSVHQLLVRHCELFHKMYDEWPYMHDPLTVAAAIGESFVSFFECHVLLDERGNLQESPNGARIDASRTESNAREFMNFLERRLFG